MGSHLRWVWAGCIAAGFLLLYALLNQIGRRLDRHGHPLGGTLRAVRNLVLPTLAALLAIEKVFGCDSGTSSYRLVLTLLWICILHTALSFLNALLFAGAGRASWRASVPRLFLDLMRFFLVLVGTAFVLSAVWHHDLGSLLAALGVGSIVIGLALQDTLGNLMAGISLLFERPFILGDWVRVGQDTGKVVEMNWRAVRIATRNREMIVVPNAILGKETITNYSRPSRLHRECYRVGFSYDDPPNRVKRVLQRAALSTRGILSDPPIEVATLSYGDFYIEYEVRFFIESYADQPLITDEFSTKIWYIARRNKLTIPFPIRTVFKTEVALEHGAEGQSFQEALQSVPVFVPMDAVELETLARDAVLQHFGRNERIVYQGEPGEALYIIRSGHAVVSVSDERGAEREVARLRSGEFFGEMALLTGEVRTANVTAQDDLEVIVIYPETLKEILARRPALAEEIAEIAETRRQGLAAVVERSEGKAAEEGERERSGSGDLLRRIKHFLGV